MRIHTNATLDQIKAAVAKVSTAHAERLTEHKSRTHDRAFELNLSGSGRYGGQYGATDCKSATWDEWGVVMAAIFDADPSTRMGGSAKVPVYADADDYHWQTADRFRRLTMPTDTHAVHRWDWANSIGGGYYVASCKKCSAVKRWTR